MGNKRNRNFRLGQSRSFEREINASEGKETIFETLSNFKCVSLLGNREVVISEVTQNENEMCVAENC